MIVADLLVVLRAVVLVVAIAALVLALLVLPVLLVLALAPALEADLLNVVVVMISRLKTKTWLSTYLLRLKRKKFLNLHPSALVTLEAEV